MVAGWEEKFEGLVVQKKTNCRRSSPAARIHTTQPNPTTSSFFPKLNPEPQVRPTYQFSTERYKWILHYTKPQDDDDTGKKLSDDDSFIQVTATLIVTVTFAVAFTMPGGYIQSGGADEGMALLSSKAAFQAFLVFDLLAFFSSLAVVLGRLISRIQLKQKPKPKAANFLIDIRFAFIGMALAFTCDMYVVLANSVNFRLAALILCICLTVAALFVLPSIIKPPKWLQFIV